MINDKKEKLYINIVLALFILAIVCCFTLYPILCDTVSAEELTNNSVLNFNQLFNNTISRSNYNTIAITKNNLTYSIKGYFTDYTLNLGFNEGSPSINLISGHKYYLDFNLNVLSGPTPELRLFAGDSSFFNNGNQPQIITMSSSPTCSIGLYVNPHIHSSSNPYNFSCTPMLVDLTQCFGVGNEPSTVEDFRSYFVSDYYAYTLSTLVSLDSTTSYSQGYIDGMQSFSIVTAGDDLFGTAYFLNSTRAITYLTESIPPYFYSLLPVSSDTPLDYLVFPMKNPIPANSNFNIKGYISSYVHQTSGTLNIYALMNNKDVISLGTVSFSGTTFAEFSLNINVPFGVSNICFNTSNSAGLLGDVQVTYKISNLDKLAQDNFNKGKESVDVEAIKSQAFNQGKQAGIESANKYTFGALFSSVIDAPVKAITGLLNFEIFGVNLKSFMLSLFTIGLVIAIVKLFLGNIGGGNNAK